MGRKAGASPSPGSLRDQRLNLPGRCSPNRLTEVVTGCLDATDNLWEGQEFVLKLTPGWGGGFGEYRQCRGQLWAFMEAHATNYIWCHGSEAREHRTWRRSSLLGTDSVALLGSVRWILMQGKEDPCLADWLSSCLCILPSQTLPQQAWPELILGRWVPWNVQLRPPEMISNVWPGTARMVQQLAGSHSQWGEERKPPAAFWIDCLLVLFLWAISVLWQRLFGQLSHSPVWPSTHPDEHIFNESQVRHGMWCWGFKRLMTSLWLHQPHQSDSIIMICGFARMNSWVAVFGRAVLNSDHGETLFDHLPTCPVPSGHFLMMISGPKREESDKGSFWMSRNESYIQFYFNPVSNHRFVSLFSKPICFALNIFFS